MPGEHRDDLDRHRGVEHQLLELAPRPVGDQDVTFSGSVCTASATGLRSTRWLVMVSPMSSALDVLRWCARSSVPVMASRRSSARWPSHPAARQSRPIPRRRVDGRGPCWSRASRSRCPRSLRLLDGPTGRCEPVDLDGWIELLEVRAAPVPRVVVGTVLRCDADLLGDERRSHGLGLGHDLTDQASVSCATVASGPRSTAKYRSSPAEPLGGTIGVVLGVEVERVAQRAGEELGRMTRKSLPPGVLRLQ